TLRSSENSGAAIPLACDGAIRKTPTSKIEELESAGHARGNFRFVKIRAADRSDVSRGQSHCRGNEIVIAKNAVGSIQANPAGTGQKNFRPGVERTFGAPPLGIAFSQISANESRGQAH